MKTLQKVTPMDTAELTAAAEALKGAWDAVEQRLVALVLAAGGKIYAEVTLPNPVQDRFKGADYKYHGCSFSKARLMLSADPYSRSPKLGAQIKLGVSGKNGTFFPKPNEHDAQVRVQRIEQGWKKLLLEFGTAGQSAAAILAASAAATSPM